MTTKAVLYARVSTRDKDQNPEVQFRALRPWVKARGWTVAFDRDFAGAHAPAPG